MRGCTLQEVFLLRCIIYKALVFILTCKMLHLHHSVLSAHQWHFGGQLPLNSVATEVMVLKNLLVQCVMLFINTVTLWSNQLAKPPVLSSFFQRNCINFSLTNIGLNKLILLSWWDASWQQCVLLTVKAVNTYIYEQSMLIIWRFVTDEWIKYIYFYTGNHTVLREIFCHPKIE